MNDLSVYVHIPFCVRKCRYCSFYSVPLDAQILPSFLKAVLTELDLYAANLPIETLYIGGGSPSLLKAEHLIPFLRQLLGRTGPVCEWTVEINPAQADQKLFAQLKDLGVSRLSFGAQSFHQKDLDFLGRLHRVEDIGRSVALARAAGFDNIGLDLIYEQELSKFKEREIEAQMEKKYFERFQFPLGLAVLLLVIETCLTPRKKEKKPF